jgi:hypothetical protein
MGFDGLPWDLSVNGTSAEPAGSALHPSVTSFRLKKALMKSSHSGALSARHSGARLFGANPESSDTVFLSGFRVCAQAGASRNDQLRHSGASPPVRVTRGLVVTNPESRNTGSAAGFRVRAEDARPGMTKKVMRRAHIWLKKANGARLMIA